MESPDIFPELSARDELDGIFFYSYRSWCHVLSFIHAIPIFMVACASTGICYDDQLGAVHCLVFFLVGMAVQIFHLESRWIAIVSPPPTGFPGHSCRRGVNRRNLDSHRDDNKSKLSDFAGIGYCDVEHAAGLLNVTFYHSKSV